MSQPVEVKVRRLERGDDRTKFKSGNIDLDRFFCRYAGQNQFRHYIGATYVAVVNKKIDCRIYNSKLW